MPRDKSFLKETDELRDLRVLEAIEANPRMSQRELADRLGVAVGIANACIHTLARKGMVKIRGENNRSLTYHLTKRGVLHKGRLAVEWTRNTINFYVHARQMVSEEMGALVADGTRTLALYGSRELGEIALMVSSDHLEAKVVGIIRAEGDANREQLFGVPVGGFEILESGRPDALLLCSEPSETDLAAISRARDAGATRVVSLFDKTI